MSTHNNSRETSFPFSPGNKKQENSLNIPGINYDRQMNAPSPIKNDINLLANSARSRSLGLVKTMSLSRGSTFSTGRSPSINSLFPDDHSPENSARGGDFNFTANDQLAQHQLNNSYPSAVPGVTLPPPSVIVEENDHLSFHASLDSGRSPVSYAQLPASPLAVLPFSGEMRTTGVVRHVPLYVAALKGDWSSAAAYIQRHPDAQWARITRGLETALHIAAGARHTQFVEQLVREMTPDELAIQNRVGNTALCFAAASGIKRIAEVMVEKNVELPLIRGSQGATPLYMAALLGHTEMVRYLYDFTREHLNQDELGGLLVACIRANLFDVALEIIDLDPSLAIGRDGNGETALHVLARKPSVFFSGSRLSALSRFIYTHLRVELQPNAPDCSSHDNIVILLLKDLGWKILNLIGIKTIYEEKLKHVQALELTKQLWEQVLLLDDSNMAELIKQPTRLVFVAAELGIVEFIKVLIESYPDLIWKVDDHSRSIFHIAVAHRQEKIFNLIYDIGALRNFIAAYKDKSNNNMLHLAGKLAPPQRLNTDSGAAFQLRRELQWFKEVEKIVEPSYKQMKNSDGKTPKALFAEEHKTLLGDGENWMRNTASSCMVVAALIATVMFQAAFTIPGGGNQDNSELHMDRISFRIFIISDALSLFTSATSILMFLSILTSRYADEDFVHSLPNKLVTGLITLFVSIATMMVSFCAALFIVIGGRYAFVAIIMALAASLPVSLFAFLQFPLLVDMISHAYMSNILFRPLTHLFY